MTRFTKVSVRKKGELFRRFNSDSLDIELEQMNGLMKQRVSIRSVNESTMVSLMRQNHGQFYRMYEFICSGSGKRFDDAYSRMMDGIVQQGELYYCAE